MGKIIITEEQNKRIKSFLKMTTKVDFLESHIKGWACVDNECLKSLSVDKMARILYEPGSYEVETIKPKIGDYVAIKNGDNFNHSNKKLAKVSKIGDFTICVDGQFGSFTYGFIRLATSEEIIFAELGREVGEFINEDIVKDHNGKCFQVNRKLPGKTSSEMYKDGELSGFYPANSFIKLS